MLMTENGTQDLQITISLVITFCTGEDDYVV